MTTQRLQRLLGDRGSVTLELAVLTPALILLLGLVALAGRVEVAASAVDHAAAAGARAASLTRTPAAQTTATDAVRRELNIQGLHCVTSTVTVDASGLNAALGAPATVTVTASCTVTIADLAVRGLPGTRTLTGHATSTIDRYRTR